MISSKENDILNSDSNSSASNRLLKESQLSIVSGYGSPVLLNAKISPN